MPASMAPEGVRRSSLRLPSMTCPRSAGATPASACARSLRPESSRAGVPGDLARVEVGVDVGEAPAPPEAAHLQQPVAAGACGAQALFVQLLAGHEVAQAGLGLFADRALHHQAA